MKYVKDNKREQIKFEKRLRQLQKSPHVAVGILQNEPVANSFSIVDLATVHEFGSADGRIPQRSFFRSTLQSQKQKHLRLITQLQKLYIVGKLSLKQALTQLGEAVRGDIVETISHGVDPKLEASTVKRKKSSQPLIDTGRLKGSITHQVRGLQ